MINTSNIHYYMQKGWYMKDWYETEAKKLIELLPEFEGLPILEFFAVTSMTTSIEANVHLAIKALLQLRNNQTFIGFLPNQEKYLYMIKNGEEVPGRKISNFIKALNGDPNAVVVDIWMCRAFDIAKRRKFKGRQYWLAPTPKEYDEIENWIIDKCYPIKMEPRQMQSAIWVGIKKELGVLSSKRVGWAELVIKKKGMFSYAD